MNQDEEVAIPLPDLISSATVLIAFGPVLDTEGLAFPGGDLDILDRDVQIDFGMMKRVYR